MTSRKVWETLQIYNADSVSILGNLHAQIYLYMILVDGLSLNFLLVGSCPYCVLFHAVP